MRVTPDAINTVVAESYAGSRMRCTGVAPTWALAAVVAEPDDIRPGGYISGPTQFALVDAALWYLVFGVLDRIEPMAVTSELSIRYVRPAIGSRLTARAELVSQSRRSIVGSVRVWVDEQTERPSSVAMGTYAIPQST